MSWHTRRMDLSLSFQPSDTGEGNGLEGMEGLCFAKKGLRMATRMFSHVCPAGLDKAGRMLFARLFEW